MAIEMIGLAYDIIKLSQVYIMIHTLPYPIKYISFSV